MQQTQSPNAGERTLPIMGIEFHGRKYAVVQGKTHYIIAENDFVHVVYPNSERAELEGAYPSAARGSMPLEEINDQAMELNLAEFGHYWGIKQRVAANYAKLRKSMQEIGVSDKDMPAFGD